MEQVVVTGLPIYIETYITRNHPLGRQHSRTERFVGVPAGERVVIEQVNEALRDCPTSRAFFCPDNGNPIAKIVVYPSQFTVSATSLNRVTVKSNPGTYTHYGTGRYTFNVEVTYEFRENGMDSITPLRY